MWTLFYILYLILFCLVKHQMPNFELQLVERLANIEKKLKTIPKGSPVLGRLRQLKPRYVSEWL